LPLEEALKSGWIAGTGDVTETSGVAAPFATSALTVPALTDEGSRRAVSSTTSSAKSFRF
jgi:hypothetical protein